MASTDDRVAQATEIYKAMNSSSPLPSNDLAPVAKAMNAKGLNITAAQLGDQLRALSKVARACSQEEFVDLYVHQKMPSVVPLSPGELESLRGGDEAPDSCTVIYAGVGSVTVCWTASGMGGTWEWQFDF